MSALPQTVGFTAVDLGFDWPHAVNEAPSGGTQSVETAAHRWTMTARWPQLARDEWAPIMAFIMARAGASESFTVIPPHLAVPRGPAGGTPIVNGPGLVNGGFDADTDWTKGAGWTIGSGVATHTVGTSSGLEQAVTLVTGVSYAVTYTITTLSAGLVRCQLWGGTVVQGTYRAAAGTYTETLTAMAGNTALRIEGADTFDGAVDDVSIAVIGNVLPITGCTVSTSGWMKEGDVVGLAGHGKVYMLTADADTDGAGSVALAIEPGLIETPADGEALTVANVPFTMGLVGTVQSFPMQAPLLMTYELDLRERPS